MKSATAKADEASRVGRKRPSLATAAQIKRIDDILRLGPGQRVGVLEEMTPLECAQLIS